jgi:hypothetical protein
MPSESGFFPSRSRSLPSLLCVGPARSKQLRPKIIDPYQANLVAVSHFPDSECTVKHRARANLTRSSIHSKFQVITEPEPALGRALVVLIALLVRARASARRPARAPAPGRSAGRLCNRLGGLGGGPQLGQGGGRGRGSGPSRPSCLGKRGAARGVRRRSARRGGVGGVHWSASGVMVLEIVASGVRVRVRAADRRRLSRGAGAGSRRCTRSPPRTCPAQAPPWPAHPSETRAYETRAYQGD